MEGKVGETEIMKTGDYIIIIKDGLLPMNSGTVGRIVKLPLDKYNSIRVIKWGDGCSISEGGTHYHTTHEDKIKILKNEDEVMAWLI